MVALGQGLSHGVCDEVGVLQVQEGEDGAVDDEQAGLVDGLHGGVELEGEAVQGEGLVVCVLLVLVGGVGLGGLEAIGANSVRAVDVGQQGADVVLDFCDVGARGLRARAAPRVGVGAAALERGHAGVGFDLDRGVERASGDGETVVRLEDFAPRNLVVG